MSSVPAYLRRIVLKRDGNRCLKCGSMTNLTIDHVIPLSKGGVTTELNAQAACGPCNVEKDDRIEYWGTDPRVHKMINEHRKGRTARQFDEQKVQRAKKHCLDVIARNKMGMPT
jgi:5-methylcytosine-specific restriction endonuclease McrA